VKSSSRRLPSIFFGQPRERLMGHTIHLADMLPDCISHTSSNSSSSRGKAARPPILTLKDRDGKSRCDSRHEPRIGTQNRLGASRLSGHANELVVPTGGETAMRVHLQKPLLAPPQLHHFGAPSRHPYSRPLVCPECKNGHRLCTEALLRRDHAASKFQIVDEHGCVPYYGSPRWRE
jgi:hypothetical protein